MRFTVVGRLIKDPMTKKMIMGHSVVDSVTGQMQKVFLRAKEARALAVELNRKELKHVRDKG